MKNYRIKTSVVIAAAVLGISGAAFAGQTQAERENALRQSAAPESALGWEIRPALEAGGLPSGHTGGLKQEGGAKTEVPTVEIAGRVYRIGIDTP